MKKRVAQSMFNFAVFVIGLLLCTSLAAWQDQAKELVLTFHEDSIGTIRYREPQKDEAVRFERIAPWQDGGQAKGTVRLPENSVVSLTIANSSAEALKALSELPSDSIHEILCTNSKYDGNILIPISHFTSLRSLSLSGIPITDQQLDSIKRLPNLEVLYLSDTKITGSSFKQISKLKKLRVLYLYNRTFNEEQFADLVPAKNLNELHFSSVELGDVAARHLSQIPSLTQIRCPWRLSDKGLEHLASLDKLEMVYHFGDVNDAGVNSLAKMKSLKHLWFQQSNVSDHQIRALDNNGTLESLSFSSPAISANVLETLASIPTLKNLSFINVQPEQDFDSNWHLLAKLGQLRVLKLNGIELTKKHLESLSKLKNLRQLEIECPNIVDKSLGHAMAGMSDLEEAYIRAITNLTDDEIKPIASLKKLSYLSIDETRITDAGLLAFSNKPYLFQLSIGSELVTDDAFEELLNRAPHEDLEVSRNEHGRSFSKVGQLLMQGQGKTRKPFDTMQGKALPKTSFEFFANVPEDFQLKDLEKNVVLVQFWGTWCGPCVQAMPKLKALHDKHSKSGFEIVSIHSTNGASRMQEYVTKNKIKWPAVSDKGDETRSSWNVSFHPTYFLLNKDLKVVHAAIAFESLDEAISKMLDH